MAWKYLRKEVWWIGYRHEGEQYRFSTKTTNKQAAEHIRSKIEVDLAEGRFLDRKEASSLTLKEFGDDLYLPRLKVAKPRSYAWRKDRYAQLRKVLGDDFPLESVDDAAADSYVESRRQTVSLRTVKEDMAVLRHALGMAYRWRRETLISEWKLRDWRAPEETDDVEPEPIDPTAWKNILQIARQKAKSGRWEEEHGLAVMLLARTLGARRGEVLRLEREDVDLESGLIRRRVLKKRKPERIETRIDGEPLKWLRRVAESHGHSLIFCNPKTGHLRRDQKRYWTTVRREAKATGTRFHAIRHSYGRDFLEAGGSMRELQGRLGHSSIRTTEKYAHLAKRSEPAKGIPIE